MIPLSPITHELTLPLDHPDGERPKVVYESNKFRTDQLNEVLKTMANETHVLILIDTNRVFDEFIDKMVLKLKKDGYVQHHVFKQDRTGAEAWVKYLNQMKKTVPGKESKKEQKAKYLLVDWLSAAGYEAPAVIFVTDDLNRLEYATYCQRAKAKLTIYIANNPRGSYEHLSRCQYLDVIAKRIFVIQTLSCVMLFIAVCVFVRLLIFVLIALL